MDLPEGFVPLYPRLRGETLRAVLEILPHAKGLDERYSRNERYEHLVSAAVAVAMLRELNSTGLIPLSGDRRIADIIDELMINSGEALGIEPKDFRYYVSGGQFPSSARDV